MLKFLTHPKAGMLTLSSSAQRVATDREDAFTVGAAATGGTTCAKTGARQTRNNMERVAACMAYILTFDARGRGN
jgi:hypothetical protein